MGGWEGVNRRMGECEWENHRQRGAEQRSPERGGRGWEGAKPCGLYSSSSSPPTSSTSSTSYYYYEDYSYNYDDCGGRTSSTASTQASETDDSESRASGSTPSIHA